LSNPLRVVAIVFSGLSACHRAPRRPPELGQTDAYVEQGQLARAYQDLLAAQVLAPKDPAIRAKLARIYLITDRTSEAREHAFSILDAEPQNSAGVTLLAATAMTPSQIDDAISRLNALPKKSGDLAQESLALASLYKRKGDLAKASQYKKEAIAADPRTAADTQSIRGAETYLVYGERDQAKTALRSIAATDSPGSTGALRLLAELALVDGDTTAAVEMSRRVLQKDSADVDALLQAGRARFLEQKTSEAVSYFQKALAADPKLAPAHYYLGTALLHAHNVQSAREHLEDAIKLTGNYPEALSQYAALNMQAETPRAVIDDANRLVKLNPHSLEARRVLGEALLGADKANEADETFREAIKMSPDRPEPHYWFAADLAKQGKKAEAKRELEAALRVSPNMAEAMAQLISFDVSEGKLDSALARVTNQIRIAPQSAPLYDLLGTVRQARNERDAAAAAFQTSTQLDPKLASPRAHLANLYVMMQRFDLAIAEGETAHKLDPQNVSALLALGVAYQTKGDFPHARQAYEQALAADPTSTAAANNLAFLLSETSTDQTEALRYGLSALKVAPNDPHIQDTAGWILYKAGRYSDALPILRASAQTLRDAPDVQYHYAMVAQKSGDTATARRALALAVGTTIDYPGKEDARRALALLK